MIGYVTLGTNDMAKAAKFYDALLGEIGAKRIMEGDNFIAWGTSMEAPGLGVIKPHDGKAATIGNGTMVALACDKPATVDKLYKKAMALGAKDEAALVAAVQRVARDFAIRDGDTVYVTEAPFVQWQKSISALTGSVGAANSISTAAGN